MDPLTYRISKWEQLKQCKSNNSRSYHVKVSKFLQNNSIRGTLISVYHDIFGDLFSCLVDRSGDLIDSSIPELTTQEILRQLKCFGFHVEFPQKDNLAEAQLSYLNMLRDLKYDKLRVCSYQRPSDNKVIHSVTAFKIDKLPSWIFNTFEPTYKEYIDAVSSGAAFNLSNVTETNNFNWDWLDFIANIDDILSDNDYNIHSGGLDLVDDGEGNVSVISC